MKCNPIRTVIRCAFWPILFVSVWLVCFPLMVALECRPAKEIAADFSAILGDIWRGE